MYHSLNPHIVSRLKRRLAEANVIVVGDVTCDITLLCSTKRPSHRASVSGFHEISCEYPLLGGKAGAAGVVARVLEILGIQTKLFAAVGADPHGQEVIESVGKDVFHGLVLQDQETTVKCRYYLESSLGAFVPYLKVNHDVLPADFPEHLRSGLLKECLGSILSRNDAEPVSDGIIVADYGKGLVDGALIVALNEALDNHHQQARRVELTLLTRGWRETYRDMHYTHVFWDASELFPADMPFGTETALDSRVLDVAREWFRRLGTLRTLVVTLGNRNVFYFRNLAYPNLRSADKTTDTESLGVVARRYELLPERIADNPDYTGFRSVLATAYVGLRAATNPLKKHELHPIRDQHFEYAMNAATVQLSKIATDLPSGMELFDALRDRQRYELHFEESLDMRMTSGSLLFGLKNALQVVESDLDGARELITKLFEDYATERLPISEQVRQVALRFEELDEINKKFGQEIGELSRHFARLHEDGREIPPDKQGFFASVLANLKELDAQSFGKLIRLLKEIAEATQ